MLGATINNITSMITSDFLKLIALSLLIAFPIAWLAMEQVASDLRISDTDLLVGVRRCRRVNCDAHHDDGRISEAIETLGAMQGAVSREPSATLSRFSSCLTDETGLSSYR